MENQSVTVHAIIVGYLKRRSPAMEDTTYMNVRADECGLFYTPKKINVIIFFVKATVFEGFSRRKKKKTPPI